MSPLRSVTERQRVSDSGKTAMARDECPKIAYSAAPDGLHSGKNSEISVRMPLAETLPKLFASSQERVPVARFTQVTASISTTFGGVPRVCLGPSTH